MKLKLSLLLSACLLLVFSSCEGPAGEDGNANVRIYNFTNFSWNDLYGDGTAYTADLELPALTSQVYNTHLVLGFVTLNFNGNTVRWSLPYVFTSPNGYNESINLAYTPYSGSNNIGFLASSDDGLPSVYQDVISFRVALIEGSFKRDFTWEELINMPNVEFIEVDGTKGPKLQ